MQPILLTAPLFDTTQVADWNRQMRRLCRFAWSVDRETPISCPGLFDQLYLAAGELEREYPMKLLSGLETARAVWIDGRSTIHVDDVDIDVLEIDSPIYQMLQANILRKQPVPVLRVDPLPDGSLSLRELSLIDAKLTLVANISRAPTLRGCSLLRSVGDSDDEDAADLDLED